MVKEEKNMKIRRRIFAVLLSLAMVITLMPAVSFADGSGPGPTVNIERYADDSSGTGWAYVGSTHTLTLTDYNGGAVWFNHNGYSGDFNIVLVGTNTITVDFDASKTGNSGENSGLFGYHTDIKMSGDGSLTINMTNASAEDSTSVSNGIYTQDTFTMSSGTLTVNVAGKKEVNGINAYDGITIDGTAKATINVKSTAANYENSQYISGLNSFSKIKLDSGGDIDISFQGFSKMANGILSHKNGGESSGVSVDATPGFIELSNKNGSKTTIKNLDTGTDYEDAYGITNLYDNSYPDSIISLSDANVSVDNCYLGILNASTEKSTPAADITVSSSILKITSERLFSAGIVSHHNGIDIADSSVDISTYYSAVELYRIQDHGSENYYYNESTHGLDISGSSVVVLNSSQSSSAVSNNPGILAIDDISLDYGGSVSAQGAGDGRKWDGYIALGDNTAVKDISDYRVYANSAGTANVYYRSSTEPFVIESTIKYTASLSPNGVTFPAKVYGYSELTPQTFTLTSTGTAALENISAALSGANAESFTLNKAGMAASLDAAGGTTTSTSFTVVPNTGLTAGTYTANVEVTATNLTKITKTVTFQVGAAGTKSISGSVTSYSNAKDVAVKLYPYTAEDSLIRTDMKNNAGAGAFGYVSSTGDATGSAPAYSRTYTIADVGSGTYKLAVYEPGHGIRITEVTMVTDDITGQNITLYRLGDVNGNAAVDISDMQRLYEHLNGSNILTNAFIGDVNGNGAVDISDMQRLYEHLNGSNPLT